MKLDILLSNLDVRIDTTSFVVSGTLVPLNKPASAFERLVGRWNREYEGPQKAPCGYRNPVRYIYDGLGIDLLDDWASRRITQVTFHFLQEADVPFSPYCEFRGSLSVLNTPLDRVTAWDVVTKKLAAQFRPALAGIHMASIGHYELCAYFNTEHRRCPLLASLSVSCEEKLTAQDLDQLQTY